MSDINEGREIATLEADATVVALLNKSEIDQQIATAHKYPRSISRFRDEVDMLARLNEDVAEECSYALERKDSNGQKVAIVGPSARFAEIVVHSWGNCRAGARVVDDRGDSIVAQGAFMDLEKNVAVTYEVQRRIVNKNGNRYSADMIGVTANAACSIAIRNAVLKGVPKALWSDLWEKARACAVGDARTLAERRLRMVDKLGALGVSLEKILAKLKRRAIEDVTLADLELLIALGSSIKNNEATPDSAFATDDDDAGESSNAATNKINEAAKAKAAAAVAAKAKPAGAKQESPQLTPDHVSKLIGQAKNADQLDLAVDLVPKDRSKSEQENAAWLACIAQAAARRTALKEGA